MSGDELLDELATLVLQADWDDDPILDELRELIVRALARQGMSENTIGHLRDVLSGLDASPRLPGTLERVRHSITTAISDEANRDTDPDPDPDQQPAKPTQSASDTPATNDITVSVESDADRELLGEFVTESRDYLESAEASMLQLETDPSDAEAINTIFRAFHTIKGTSGFLGLVALSDLAHTSESLLSEIRDGSIRLTPTRATLIFRSIDILAAVLEQITLAARGEPGTIPPGYAQLLDELRTLEKDGYPEVESIAPAIAIVADVPDSEPVKQAAPAATAGASASTAEAIVRVRTERLDQLVDMVGELVIAQSMLTQDEIVCGPGNPELGRKVSHAAKIVRELQDLSMAMRMVPLKGAFQKVTRLARDLAQRGGKAVEFYTEGEDTEIDRNMVDVLADPLIHMVRNAVDHGLEMPDDRERAGKTRHGTLRLSAYHSGGSVVVELQDDGRGLNRTRIIAKAKERGLIDNADSLSIPEIDNLIFHPGFSTAEAVTELSGRGVGMDVVRRNVEAMRGRIDIDSDPGKGTKFTIRLPLTLAITDGMLVSVGTERYLVPTLHIQSSFRPSPSQLKTVAGRGELVVVRGVPIPILRLHRVFSIPGAIEHASDGLLMLVGDGRSQTALLVDELLGQQQVVAKSLGEALGRIPGLAGGAILGDGRVGLILDVTELNLIVRRSAGGIPELASAA